jgi:4-amino-4-deoxy-L-arabinose transferase-like glycosyltransferase
MRAAAFTSPLEASIYVEGLRARPAFFVGLFLLLHAAMWTVAAWLANPTPDPQLAIEHALGREWQLGYVDSPPLAPWVLEIAHRLGGLVAAYALGPLTVALAGWLVFIFARRIVGDRHGALAVFLMVGVHPVAFPVASFDSDLVQMPLAALAVLAWWRAITERNRIAWVVLAVTCGVLAYAGVQWVFVLATLGFITVTSTTGRNALRSQEDVFSAVLALFIFMLLLTPRMIWLQDHGFAGVTRGVDLASANSSLTTASGVATAVIFGHVGLLLLLVLGSSYRATDEDIAPVFVRPDLTRFAAWTAILIAMLPAPLAFIATYFPGIRCSTAAAAPLLLYSGLLAVVLAPQELRVHRQRTVAVAGLTLLLLPPLLEIALAFVSPWIGDARPTNWPAADASRYITDVYRTRTGRRLEYVIGDITTASSIALLSRDRPGVFIDADPKRAPWADRAKIETTGAVVVWRTRGGDATPPATLAAKLPPLVAEAPLVLRWVRSGNLDFTRVGWAIIPPKQ